MMKVLFAPDWRAGVPYQDLLAKALEQRGVEIDFASNYRRRLPLVRAIRNAGFDLLHMHWPEAYCPQFGDRWDGLRKLRYALDLRLAARGRPIVYTAHNLYPHNRGHEPLTRWNIRFTARSAAAVIVHSQAAKAALANTFHLSAKRVEVIAHGDLSTALPPPATRGDARAALQLGPQKRCLVFGTIEPYKGLEEAIRLWRETTLDAHLVIVGKPLNEAYAADLQRLAASDPRIRIHPGWLDDGQLRLWLSAADAALFNYRAIFTSGAASLARSWGLPILLPARLEMLDMQEPCERVIRFEPETLSEKVALALQLGRDFESAAEWRRSISWDLIAEKTAALYERIHLARTSLR